MKLTQNTNQFYRKYLQKFLLPFLFLYFIISSFSSIFHNHDENFEFHDDCPACIWESQSQSDFSEVLSFINNLLNPVEQITFFTEFEETLRVQNAIQDSHFSRAPPIAV